MCCLSDRLTRQLLHFVQVQTQTPASENQRTADGRKVTSALDTRGPAIAGPDLFRKSERSSGDQVNFISGKRSLVSKNAKSPQAILFPFLSFRSRAMAVYCHKNNPNKALSYKTQNKPVASNTVSRDNNVLFICLSSHSYRFGQTAARSILRHQEQDVQNAGEWSPSIHLLGRSGSANRGRDRAAASMPC